MSARTVSSVSLVVLIESLRPSVFPFTYAIAELVLRRVLFTSSSFDAIAES